ncbi:unnamed protein product, partial [Rotaria sp. Silwood2]
MIYTDRDVDLTTVPSESVSNPINEEYSDLTSLWEN